MLNLWEIFTYQTRGFVKIYLAAHSSSGSSARILTGGRLPDIKWPIPQDRPRVTQIFACFVAFFPDHPGAFLSLAYATGWAGERLTAVDRDGEREEKIGRKSGKAEYFVRPKNAAVFLLSGQTSGRTQSVGL